MFSDNLIRLRKHYHFSQEELGERIGVTRQAVAKWESGESQPDLERSRQLAVLFGVSLDELAGEELLCDGLPLPPRGRHFFGRVKLGDRGQIVIPARARAVFRLAPGDGLVVLGDEASGIALLPENAFLTLADAVLKSVGKEND